jgi:hypothetical protein
MDPRLCVRGLGDKVSGVRVEESAFVVSPWSACIPRGGESPLLCDCLVARDPLSLFLDAPSDPVL